LKTPVIFSVVICNIDGFSWETIAGHRIPYIMRVVNGKLLKFVATRMAEYQLLKKYLNSVPSHIYTSCTSVIAYKIIDPEVKILNHINEKYYGYGKDYQFHAGIDNIVSLDDVHNFYLFLEVCYKKLLSNITPDYNDKCGFIQINSNSSSSCLPYCTQDDQRYVPLFFLQGDAESLSQRTVKLEKWNLAYLKFCCRIYGIRDELFYGNSWLVVSLDYVKNSYPPETDFADIWLPDLAHVYLLINQKSFHSNSESWFRAVLEVVPDQNTISHTWAASVPINPHSILVTKNQQVLYLYNL